MASFIVFDARLGGMETRLGELIISVILKLFRGYSLAKLGTVSPRRRSA